MYAWIRARRGRVLRCPVIALAASAIFLLDFTPTYAQNGQQIQWLELFILHVKPDRVGEFESLVKQMTAASAKAGQPAAMVWEVAAGQGSVYHVLIPGASMAALNDAKPPLGPAQMALWGERIGNTIDSSKHFFAHLISQTTAENAQPGMLTVLQSIKIEPGKQDEFIAWAKNDLLPALKKADFGATFSQGIFGDSPQNFYFAGNVANWAEFDKPNPVVRALGQQGAQALMDKVSGIIEENQITVLRPRPDLMAPTGAGSQ